MGQLLIIANLSRCWTFSPCPSPETSQDPSSDTSRCPPVLRAVSPRHTLWDTSCGFTSGFTTAWAVGDPRHTTRGTSSGCTSGFTSAWAVGDPRLPESSSSSSPRYTKSSGSTEKSTSSSTTGIRSSLFRWFFTRFSWAWYLLWAGLSPGFR